MNLVGSAKAVYIRGEKVNVEEDLTHEFKGHRVICREELKLHQLSGRQRQTRQEWSKYLCGMLNTGLGGTLYGGILDDGSVAGFLMSRYQQLHVMLALQEVFSRFQPTVPKESWSVTFVPVVEKGQEMYQKDPSRVRPELWTLSHKLRDNRYCWCDCDSLAAFSLGYLNPFYVIEVKCEPWRGEKCSQPAYRCSDGQYYVRKHGVTEMYSEMEMNKWKEEQEAELRRGRINMLMKKVRRGRGKMQTEQMLAEGEEEEICIAN